jgi:hypothetical protein
MSGGVGSSAGPDPVRNGSEVPDELLSAGVEEPSWYTRLMAPARRHPGRTRALTWGVGGLAVGIALASALWAGRGPTTPAAATTKHNGPATSGTMERVLEIANPAMPLTDYVRQTSAPGACAIVPVGQSPTDAIIRTVRAALPRLSSVMVARTLDQFTGLCSVELRATFDRRSTLAVSIAAPTSRHKHTVYTVIEIGIVNVANRTTKYVQATTPSGWSVLIGATGPGAHLPSAQDLLGLAQEPSLTW